MVTQSIKRSARIRILLTRITAPRKGAYLPFILIASVLFIAYVTAILSLAYSNVKTAELHNKKITAMSIAEAGINYYMWHLAHDNDDYCDGQVCTGESPYGPFIHEYKDVSGRVLGNYELYITPPESSGTVTVVKSIGKVDNTSPRRTIIAELGMPAFTRYTLLSNEVQVWVGGDEKITGTVHVNHNGLYNQGEITGDTSSTELTYNGWFGIQPGVAGPGTFGGLKSFPVPPVDFNQLNVNILNLRNKARDAGEGHYFAPSNQNGYHVVLGENSFDVYYVKKYDNGGSNPGFDIIEQNFVGNYQYHTAGVIFVEDDLWVEGTIRGQKATLIAADPEANNNQAKNIYIPNSIRYSNFDGQDKIGLISQKNILLTRNVPNALEIDAAMIAKNGEIRINSYCTNKALGLCDHKDNIRVYGSMAHRGGLLWTIDLGGGRWSGYESTETIVDNNNILNPPPKFPVTGAYSILSWREE